MLFSLFLAARNIELAAQISKENLNDPKEAAALYVKGNEYYQVKGMNDKAAESLGKAAKCVRFCARTICS